MTTLVLDRTAIDRLLVDDEFKFQLTNSVVSHIARKFFEKDAARIISATQPELFAKAIAAMQLDADFQGKIEALLTAKLVKRDGGYYGKMTLTADAAKLVDDAIKAAMFTITRQVQEKVDAVVQGEAQRLFDQTVGDLDARIAKRLETITNQHISAKITEGVAAKVAAINEALK